MTSMRFAGPHDRTSVSRARSAGFSLLEVLVALLVFSIGLVGIAALNVNALRNVHSAQQASLASSMALDFEERLWLRLADTASGCPDHIAARQDLLAAWTSTAPPFETWGAPVRLPNVAVNVSVAPRAGPGGGSVIVSFDIDWAEQRLTAEDVARDEVFAYEVEVLCRETL